MNNKENFVIGIDFGTDSVRSLVVDASDGSTLGLGISNYKRWANKDFCNLNKNEFRQNPKDYLESMEEAVLLSLKDAGTGARQYIRGICSDTTGSSPCLIDQNAKPLALQAEFENDPDAMFVLWKDHSSIAEAEKINKLAHSWANCDYTKFSGGQYSSEWFWAKALHIIESNKKVTKYAKSIIEHCDWMPALLCGINNLENLKRGRCSAGHKAMWHESWGGYPSQHFLNILNPQLALLATSLNQYTETAEREYGKLSNYWAEKFNLSNVSVSIGLLDAHAGAIGGNIELGTLIKIMGTSTCDIMVAKKETGEEKPIKGICGQVLGSVIPELLGLEAGQSAFGDILAWYKELLSWSLKELVSKKEKNIEINKIADLILPSLEEEAQKIPCQNLKVLSLDWLNGRRSPDANQNLTASITNLSLSSNAAMIYRSLIEALAFGSKAIVERFKENFEVKKVVAIGGVANKSNLVMQTMANVLNMEINLIKSTEPCALGSAMIAATTAGIYKNLRDAQEKMKSPIEKVFKPNLDENKIYETRYIDYRKLGLVTENIIK